MGLWGDGQALDPRRRTLHPFDLRVRVTADVAQEATHRRRALACLELSLVALDPRVAGQHAAHRRLVEHKLLEAGQQGGRSHRHEPAVGMAAEQRALARLAHHRSHVGELSLDRIR
ncbi:MAG TPA: hypothetical protein VES62_13505 [Thermoleophilaceae bacterium]|nr:hypothetical protein [Thermoleophilaceae bacterium]